MRSLIVLPLVLAMAMAEERQVMPGQMRPQSQFHSHTQPVEEEGSPVGLEEMLLEEERLHPGTHHMKEAEVPHPHLVHQEQPPMKEGKVESFPKKFPEESGSHSPVPDPHLVEEEPQFGAGGETHHHETVHDLYHNAVNEHLVPLEEEEEGLFLGTESTLNEDLFEHHPNTGIPEIEPTVGTESAAGMEVVQEPVVLPVTEGKNSRQDTVVHYSLPKELMPIHPGGGSRFEDLEKEKLEKKKMAQTKGTDDDTDNGASHEAEGLYSSAATLCLSSIIFSLSSSFRLIV